MNKQETLQFFEDVTNPNDRKKLEEVAAHIAYNIACGGLADSMSKKEIVDFVLDITKKSIESYLEDI